MSYTYKIVYELTERLTEKQLNVMQSVLDQPWVPPPGYTGQVLKSRIYRYYCDTDDCQECLDCQPLPDAHQCESNCTLDHYAEGLEP